MFRTAQFFQGQALRLIEPALLAVRQWPVESQQRARRNAMVASTVLAHRRAVREDVDEFLSARYPRLAATLTATDTEQVREG